MHAHAEGTEEQATRVIDGWEINYMKYSVRGLIGSMYQREEIKRS